MKVHGILKILAAAAAACLFSCELLGGGQEAPSAPRDVVAVAGDAEATVSWAAPKSDGGSAILAYTAWAVEDPGRFCTVSKATSCVLTGLGIGASYTFIVTATNDAGTSPASIPSNPVVPTGVYYAPSAPLNVSAVAGDGQATVSWSPPASNGGNLIFAYIARSVQDPLKQCVAYGALSCTVGDLVNGTSYSFVVYALNPITGPASQASAPVKPGGPPSAPIGITVVAGLGQVTVSWSAPVSNGGSVTAYSVTADQDTSKHCQTSGTRSCAVTGLAEGTSYTFRVVAVSASGKSPPSAPSSSISPWRRPSAPGKPVGVSGPGQVSLQWTAPESNGGTAVTHYVVTTNQDTTRKCTSTGVPNCAISGLSTGVSYTFTVVAVNAVGAGPASLASEPVTPGTPTPPGAPQQVKAVASPGQVTVSWSPPALDGGSAITGYVATSDQDSGRHCQTTGALSCVLTGFAEGSVHSFHIVAVNAIGKGPPSAVSGFITIEGPNLNALVLKQGQLFAFGSAGTLRASSDGTAWTARVSGTTKDFKAALWTGSQFVAVGTGGAVGTSPDGAAWASWGGFPTPSTLSGIAYSGSLLVAVDLAGAIWTSSEGSAWTYRASGGGSLNGVAWTGSRFVAVGDGGILVTSLDGLTWTPGSSGTTVPLYAVTWTGSRAVAVGAQGKILTSSDGISWTNFPSGTTANLYAVIQAGDRLVYAGSGGAFFTSRNDAPGVEIYTSTVLDLRALAWTGSAIVAAGDKGKIITVP
jgi:hypothetical protein